MKNILTRKQALPAMLDRVHREIHRWRVEAGWSVEELMRRAELSLQERTVLYDANMEAMSCKTLFKIGEALGMRLTLNFGKRNTPPISAEKALELLHGTLKLAKELQKRVNHR